MEKIQILLIVTVALMGLLMPTITFISKFVRSSRAKKMSQNIIKISNAILPYIEQAEKLVSFTGEEKKAFVMTKANKFAIDNGIKFNDEMTSEQIDQMVAICKKVNMQSSSEQRIYTSKLHSNSNKNYDFNITKKKIIKK